MREVLARDASPTRELSASAVGRRTDSRSGPFGSYARLSIHNATIVTFLLADRYNEIGGNRHSKGIHND